MRPYNSWIPESRYPGVDPGLPGMTIHFRCVLSAKTLGLLHSDPLL